VQLYVEVRLRKNNERKRQRQIVVCHKIQNVEKRNCFKERKVSQYFIFKKI